ncbi:MAG: hypothetical protein WDZ51_18480 [Pirellulaceae bacterium]
MIPSRISGRRLAHLPLVTGLAILALAGCGPAYDGPLKYPVQGTVTYQGQPIENGMIVFFPTQRGGGAEAGMKIVDGAFAGKATAGAKRVSIQANRPASPVEDEDESLHRGEEQYIPAKYNEASKMECEILPQANEGLEFHLD